MELVELAGRVFDGSLISNCLTPGKSLRCCARPSSSEYADGDGQRDVVLRFQIQGTGISCPLVQQLLGELGLSDQALLNEQLCDRRLPSPGLGVLPAMRVFLCRVLPSCIVSGPACSAAEPRLLGPFTLNSSSESVDSRLDKNLTSGYGVCSA